MNNADLDARLTHIDARLTHMEEQLEEQYALLLVVHEVMVARQPRTDHYGLGRGGLQEEQQ